MCVCVCVWGGEGEVETIEQKLNQKLNQTEKNFRLRRYQKTKFSPAALCKKFFSPTRGGDYFGGGGK